MVSRPLLSDLDRKPVFVSYLDRTVLERDEEPEHWCKWLAAVEAEAEVRSETEAIIVDVLAAVYT